MFGDFSPAIATLLSLSLAPRWCSSLFSTASIATPFANTYEALRCVRCFLSHPGLCARGSLLEPAPPQVYSCLRQRYFEYGRGRPARSLACSDALHAPLG